MSKQHKGLQYMSKTKQTCLPYTDSQVVHYKNPGGTIYVNNKVNDTSRYMQCIACTTVGVDPESKLQCDLPLSIDPLGKREDDNELRGAAAQD